MPSPTKKCLVFVHGIDGSAAGSEDVVSCAFGKHFRTLTYDLLGRGKSLGTPVPSHSLEAYVEQLRTVTRGIKGRFFLVGYSMGGAIAAAFAMRYPERIMKLALVCPAGRLSWIGKFASSLPFAAWKLAVPPILLGKMERAFEGVKRFQGVIQRKRDLYNDDRFLRVLYDTFREFPLSDLSVSNLKVPSLIVAASSDTVVNPASVERIARELGATAVIVMDGTHALPVRRPAAVGSAIRNFFAAA